LDSLSGGSRGSKNLKIPAKFKKTHTSQTHHFRGREG
jgi:hypothetical protein